jgi:hypothetical protein
MGFFTGRATFLRFRVDGPSPGMFGPEHLEKLANHAFGKQPREEKDGTEVGWIAGDDILDLGFDLAKNVVNDALYFSLRVDTHKLPPDLLRAYARAELLKLAADNPSGRPSIKEKKDARETARERLELEGKDGRYTRRKAFPLLWNGQTNHVLLGTTSPGALDHAMKLFKETFGCGLILIDAGDIAVRQAETGKESSFVTEMTPSPFVPTGKAPEVAWVHDASTPSHLGNEFLLWLWHVLETEGETIALADESKVAVMLSRTLVLECPRGLSGSESIRSDAPTQLPEARRAIQAGKLPRQAGLTLVRHDQQYEFTLQAESLCFSGAKLPPTEEGEERVRQEERVGQLRHLIVTVDLLYDAFLKRRLSSEWSKELERMQKWLQREERLIQAVA